MAHLPYTLKAAHRDVAEAAIRQAIVRIEEARQTGGSSSYNTSCYERALRLIRLAERDLRISERA